MSQAVSPLEGQGMEPQEKPELGIVNGGHSRVDSINSAQNSSDTEPQLYPDYSFNLSEGHLIGNSIVPVQPHRRLIRIINELAEALPDRIPHITADHHLLNHLKRERKTIASGVNAAPDIEVNDEMRHQNHPVAQLFDRLDSNYSQDDRITAGEMRVLKEDVLIITMRASSELFASKPLGQTALDTAAETE